MEDWGSIIGNGDGVIVFLNESQINSGGIYANATYQYELERAIANNYQIDAELTNGIIRNTASNKFSILKRIKDTVFKVQDSPAQFVYQYTVIAHNPDLTGQEVIGYMQADNVAGFLALPATKELALTGEDFLNYFL